MLSAEVGGIIEVPLDFAIFEFRSGGSFQREFFANLSCDGESIAAIGLESLANSGELKSGVEESVELWSIVFDCGFQAHEGFFRKASRSCSGGTIF